ncbi:DUF924 family protein [Puniceibacterium sp. IMCC21224]|uniref:DUF924 family protein n=1 Tax=Puniceibacterium sp. IMCC21224 TaxID=1618204 RepID=UPI00064E104F|nr:DUF924 family protein [Puniceibacterium sp. IMCC21224]KMK67638.1 hypothetical protein IMCC21224_112510 [Puniceibacterium sp. IMCC21224]
MVAPEDILSFWLDEIGPDGWYKGGEALDAQVRDRFEAAWTGAMEGRHALWLTYPTGSLAYIILLDQFPRNMFRDTPKSFASDRYALAAAKQAISRGWDLKIDEPARQFFYMPLMHSENLTDQDRCIRLMKERMTQTGDNNLLHARAHREVIRQFGRFPTRNAALDRCPTAPEKAYVADGGYGRTVRELVSAKG